MARTCTICTHPDRDHIDAAIVGGTPYRDIAARWDVSMGAIGRHRQSHVTEALQGVLVERREAAESLLERVERLLADAEAFLDVAKANQNVSQGLAAIRECRAVLELIGKATGELKGDGATVQVLNIATSEEWVAIRGAVFEALAQHPDARAAVAGRLRELEAA